MSPIAPQQRRRVPPALLLVILTLVTIAGWFLLAKEPPPETQSGTVRIVAPEIPDRSRPTSSPTPSIVAASLAGTWSIADNGGDPSASCDLASSVTFLPDGQYFTNGESGRYRIASGSITRFDRILYDIDAGEDRSRFDQHITEAFALSGRGSAQIGARALFRCEKRAPEERRP